MARSSERSIAARMSLMSFSSISAPTYSASIKDAMPRSTRVSYSACSSGLVNTPTSLLITGSSTSYLSSRKSTVEVCCSSDTAILANTLVSVPQYSSRVRYTSRASFSSSRMNWRSAYSSAEMVEVDGALGLVAARCLPCCGAAETAVAPVKVSAQISAVESRGLIAMTTSRLNETKSDREIRRGAGALVQQQGRPATGKLICVKGRSTRCDVSHDFNVRMIRNVKALLRPVFTIPEKLASLDGQP